MKHQPPPLVVPPRLRQLTRNKRVKDLKVFLQDVGFYDGQIDDWYGNDLRNAVAELQKSLDVWPSGDWTEATVQAAYDRYVVASSPSESAPSSLATPHMNGSVDGSPQPDSSKPPSTPDTGLKSSSRSSAAGTPTTASMSRHSPTTRRTTASKPT